MKKALLRTMIFVTTLGSIYSCSSDASEADTQNNAKVEKVTSYQYNTVEIETMDLINKYRVSKGLKALERINHMSFKSEEHDMYMIENNVVNHDNFISRSENIMKALGATNVSENIAYNFNTPEGVLNAWLASPSHKQNIEGNFTHFGLAIKIHPVNGRKYYTNIFAKI
ncbi:MAG: CAP domain-containing protein [Flavobacterium sp.]